MIKRTRLCACGCKTKIPSFDKRGRPRKYVPGHHKGHFKSGRIINSQGYILIYSPHHPFRDCRNYVREHRLVMENLLKRYLKPSEVVHHIDGNRKKNNPKNLVILKKKIHDRKSALTNPAFQRMVGHWKKGHPYFPKKT